MSLKVVLAALISVVAVNVSATSQTWDFEGATTSNDTFGNTLNYTQDGISLEISAWASTGSGCGVVAAKDGIDADSCIETARLEQISDKRGYLGIGIQNSTETNRNVWPDHGIDNANKSQNDNELEFEMVLLEFSEEVKLSSITAGLYYNKDSDTSVLAFMGEQGQTFNGAFNNANWADIVGNGTSGGWDLIARNSSFKNGTQVGSGATLGISNSGDIYSKYWLVGAVNNIFNPTGLENDWSDANDSFKFDSITTIAHADTTDTGVVNANAPASLVLVSLVGLLLMRRRS